MPQFRIVDDPDAVNIIFQDADTGLFPDWNRHPQTGHFARALYRAINSERPSYEPRAFCILDGDQPVLLAPAAYRDGAISMFGLPLVLSARGDLGAKRRKKVFALAFEHLAARGNGPAADRALISGPFGGPPQTPSDMACLDRLAAPSTHIHAVAEATLGEETVHKSLRASFRSLVNWGRNQLDIRYINGENPDRGLFERLPEFHTRIAGAGARGSDYWNVFWTEISAGRGELSLGFLKDGTLVSGTAVVDASGIAYYASGVYERDLFDKPLAHYPVYDSIVRAGQRGNTLYDLGEVYPSGSADEKEVQIGFFKKGFASAFRLRTDWNVPLTD